MSQEVQQDDRFTRVQATVPLQLRISTIPGAGRGLFVSEAVPSQGLIFSIAKPLLCIVDNSKEALQRTCDNCFATSGIHQTTSRKNLRFGRCPGCEVLSYCSAECQAEAWEHHHKAECDVLSRIRQDPRDKGEKSVTHKNARLLIRLLCLHDAGMIPEQKWDEILGLKTLMVTGQEALERQVQSLCDLVTSYEVTRLDENVVRQLGHIQYNNNLAMDQPLLRDYLSYPAGNCCVTSGICLEPFASMVNHCCDPNSWWVFNGCEFQLRAIREIPAGEELTISYIGITESFEFRQEMLLNWGIKCACSMCKKGPQGPTDGPLYRRLQNIQRLERESVTGCAPLNEIGAFIIGMVDEEGYNIGTWPIRQLYRQIFCTVIRKGNTTGALKAWLKLYYVIEVASSPPQLPGERLNSLKKLISLIRTVRRMESPLITEDVKSALPYIQGYLSRKLCEDTEKCFGDVEVAKFEKEQFQMAFGHCAESFDDRARYVQGAKVLLGWARIFDIPESNL